MASKAWGLEQGAMAMAQRSPSDPPSDDACDLRVRGLSEISSSSNAQCHVLKHSSHSIQEEHACPEPETQLSPPLLEGRRTLANRTVGELTIDGIRHSCLTLTSTALG